MTRFIPGIGIWASALLISGCATYHPLPLPPRARLADRITDVRHVLPGRERGAGSTVIDVGAPLTADQIGLLAVLNDPELLSERGEFDLAQANLVQSALLPNPSASLGYAALLGGPGTAAAYTASLTQDIAALVTYRSRVDAARAHVSQVNADLLWKEWQVAQKARLLAVDIYWNNRAISSSKTQLASFSRTVSDIERSVRHGNASLSDLTPLQASKASTEQSLVSLQLQQLKNWQDLDALLAMKPSARFAIAEPRIPALPGNLDALAAGVQDRRPDLVALQLGYRSADAGVRAAILGQFPAFVLGGSWSSDTSQVRSAGPVVTFDLPIFNRNQGQVAQARASRLLLHEQYQSRLDDAASTILALRARSLYLESHLAAARQRAASAEQQADAARKAYRSDNLDQRALADYESTALSQRLAAFDLERGLDEARITLGLELGLGLPQTRIAPLDANKPDLSRHS
jgi:outer membrane protein TolC